MVDMGLKLTEIKQDNDKERLTNIITDKVPDKVRNNES